MRPQKGRAVVLDEHDLARPRRVSGLAELTNALTGRDFSPYRGA
jgi:hypothetical protein